MQNPYKLFIHLMIITLHLTADINKGGLAKRSA